MRILCFVLLSTAHLALAQASSPPLVDSGPVSCARDADCAATERCSDFEDLGGGRWSRGVCRPRSMVSPEGLRSTDGYTFEYRGEVPEGFRLVEQPRAGLVVPGGIMFGVGYGLTAALGLGLGRPAALVPIAGPVLFTVQSWQPFGYGLGFLANTFLVILAATEVALQVTGAVLLIAGFGSPKRWLERIPVTIAASPAGLGVVGRF